MVLPHDARQQAHAGVDHRDRRRLAARENEIAEADLFQLARIDDALIDPFERPQISVTPAPRRMPRPLLVEPLAARRQQDHRRGARRTEAIAASSTSGRMTILAPPPNGVSSTVRCLSGAKSRMSTVRAARSGRRAPGRPAKGRAVRETSRGRSSAPSRARSWLGSASCGPASTARPLRCLPPARAAPVAGRSRAGRLLYRRPAPPRG